MASVVDKPEAESGSDNRGGGGGPAVAVAIATPARDWSAQAEIVLSALEAAGAAGAGPDSHENRRRHPRRRYRVQADLHLFSDAPGTPLWRLYTRDVSVRGLGFITRDRLPLGYGGVVHLPAPSGRPMSINGTLFRCREIGNGWFEGALYFNREQWIFGAE